MQLIKHRLLQNDLNHTRSARNTCPVEKKKGCKSEELPLAERFLYKKPTDTLLMHTPTLCGCVLVSALVVSHATRHPACTDLLVAEGIKCCSLSYYVCVKYMFPCNCVSRREDVWRFNGFHETAMFPNAP